MEDIKKRFKDGQVLERTCEALLERLESGSGDRHQLQVDVSSKLNELSRIATTLEQDISMQGRQVEHLWKYKVQQLSERCKALRDALGSCLMRQNLHEREREELLSRRRHHDQQASGEHEILLEHVQMRKQSLRNSHALADGILETGHNVLEALSIQNDSFLNIRTRLLDMRGTLGMSQQLMRTIERRIKQDKWIVYGSMLGIVALMIVLYIYV